VKELPLFPDPMFGHGVFVVDDLDVELVPGSVCVDVPVAGAGVVLVVACVVVVPVAALVVVPPAAAAPLTPAAAPAVASAAAARVAPRVLEIRMGDAFLCVVWCSSCQSSCAAMLRGSMEAADRLPGAVSAPAGLLGGSHGPGRRLTGLASEGRRF